MCIFCDAVHGSESECWYRLLDQLYCLHDSQVSPANIMMQIFERIDASSLQNIVLQNHQRANLSSTFPDSVYLM